MKEKACDRLRTAAAGHSPEPRGGGAEGGGQPPTPPAGRLDVRTGQAPAAAASRTEDRRGRVRGSEVAAEGPLRARTTGSAPTAGKDGSAEGPREPGPPPQTRAGAAAAGRDCANVTSRRRGRDFRTARAQSRHAPAPPRATRAGHARLRGEMSDFIQSGHWK
ncbi:RNA-binding motif protein, X chromosome-like [Equus quagga]|uniref:RNA-binding motif protein, X chromosome-like n=1 Tax=Equus quagga TaxID=89248 RepID=UPI001EE19E07|nr:RNA-binding motif protein, X chromosome-like [Equus quagga]